MLGVISSVLAKHGIVHAINSVKAQLADLMTKFNKYKEWTQQTGAGVLDSLTEAYDNDTENPVYIRGLSDLEKTKVSMCPHYAALECILGNREATKPIVHASTTDEINASTLFETAEAFAFSDDGEADAGEYNPGSPPPPQRPLSATTASREKSNGPREKSSGLLKRKGDDDSAARLSIKRTPEKAKLTVAEGVQRGMEAAAEKELEMSNRLLQMQEDQHRESRQDRLRVEKHAEIVAYSKMMNEMGFHKDIIMQKVDEKLAELANL